MSLSLIELSPPIPVSEKGTYSTQRWYKIFDDVGQRQVMSSGEQADITPELLRRQRRFQLYGYRYEIITYEDGTGTLRLHANSGASWTTVPGEYNKLIRMYGSHTYTIAPEPEGHEVFPIFRRANRKLELVGAVLWGNAIN